MTIIITSGTILLILALFFFRSWIEALAPLLFWLLVIGVIIASAILSLFLLFDGEIMGAVIVSIPVWIAAYWGNKESEKEPVSKIEKLNPNEFNQMLNKYKKRLVELTNNPDQLEKFVQQFEKKFLIGKKMAHLIGNLEWEATWNDNKSRKWRYKTIARKQASGKKEETFTLTIDAIKIIFHKPESSHMNSEYDYRKLEILNGKKKVAEYSNQRYFDAFYDWGEAGSAYMNSFKPDKWLFILNNLYIDWNNERSALEIKEKMNQKKQSVSEKYLY
jgi:hypothetical protein